MHGRSLADLVGWERSDESAMGLDSGELLGFSNLVAAVAAWLATVLMLGRLEREIDKGLLCVMCVIYESKIHTECLSDAQSWVLLRAINISASQPLIDWLPTQPYHRQWTGWIEESRFEIQTRQIE